MNNGTANLISTSITEIPCMSDHKSFNFMGTHQKNRQYSTLVSMIYFNFI